MKKNHTVSEESEINREKVCFCCWNDIDSNNNNNNNNMIN